MLLNSRWIVSILALMCQTVTASADVITDWNEKAVAFVTPRMAPPAAQRVVAIVQVAMFDAVNSIERRYRPYLVQLPAPPTTSKEAAAAAAAGAVLMGFIRRPESEIKAAVGGLSRGNPRRRREVGRHQARRGGRAADPRGARQRRLRGRRTPIGRRPGPVSMSRRRSRSPRPGRT